MPTYYDSQNNAHVLAERIGSGGEGTVYFCENRTTVAKIYHEPISEEKAEKLRWMAANKDERLLKVAAWVVDVLTDVPGGKVVGFLMPSIKAKEIHELYSLKSRRVYFPEATWHFLVHTAANVARAFYALHREDHVMGDVNHGNCVVLADGTVKLIDCDSYSVKIGAMRQLCEVGVATHLAPELQGADLSRVEREIKHDNFGLAVIVFQLLFLGRHPFAGKYLGDEEKSIEDCIRELRFAYGDGAKYKNVRQPLGTLPLEAVSPRVALMFERAFLTEDRPEAREWIEALEDLSNKLEQCTLHPGHLYFNALAACPWCEIEGQTGLMLFPFVTGAAHPNGEKSFNIFTVENLIANLGISNNLPAKPPPVLSPIPTAEVVAARKTNQRHLIISLTTQFFGLLFLMLIFGVGIAAFFGICALIFWLFFTNTSVKYLREEIEDKLSDAQQNWALFEDRWKRAALPSPQIEDDLSDIKRKVGDYQKLQQTSVRQMKSLRESATRRQLHEHLRASQLIDADIYGIREKQTQSLLENNFQTAADMHSGRLRYIPGIGERTIEKLLKWRGEIENNFVPQISENILLEEQTKLTIEAADERRRIEKEIERLFASLRSGAVALRRRQQELSKQATELAANLAQTKSNAAHLGTNSPMVIGLVLITFLTPYFGFIVSQTSRPDAVPTTSSRSSGKGYTPPREGLSAPDYASPVDGKVSKFEIYDENFTDEEIAAWSQDQRAMNANTVYSQVTENIFSSEPNYKTSERAMRFAMRLDGDKPHFLNQLGYILYMQNRHEEALKYLSRSLKIDSANAGTKTHIGMNYLKMKRFANARTTFIEIVEKHYASSDILYNLGLAHIGLKDYEAAVEVLQKAIELGNAGADVSYQLGHCFNKLGREDEAYAQYKDLLLLDSVKAAKFSKETGIVPRVEILQSN